LGCSVVKRSPRKWSTSVKTGDEGKRLLREDLLLSRGGDEKGPKKKKAQFETIKAKIYEIIISQKKGEQGDGGEKKSSEVHREHEARGKSDKKSSP